MKQLLCMGFQTPIELDGYSKYVIVYESQTYLCRAIDSLVMGSAGSECEFVLSNDGQIQKICDNSEVIINPFALDVNSKKIITELYKSVSNISITKEYQMRFAEINTEIQKYLYDLTNELDFDIEISSEAAITDFLKIFGIKICSDNDSLLAKIVNYLKAVLQIKKLTFIVFLNINTLLTNKDIFELYKFCEYAQIVPILIEHYVPEHIKDDIIMVLDKDLCEYLA